MSDHLVSLIRTWVPIAVGVALAWLATRLGIVLDESTSTGLTVGAVGLTSAVYYALVRALESRWPALGFLLGSRQAPVYGLPPAETATDYEYGPDGRLRQARSTTTWPERPSR
ncbi:hypothetical protein [Verrucosispora sp. NA02020]|uniref:hypothetical protein n=1 Tax=Verrucosispora sp. NA02020 TaxID=2742132 RepID=UPI003D737D16